MTRRARPFLVLALLSGAAALLYQVVWSRLLTLEIGLTAAAVSTVLAAFMGGLALGAFLVSRYVARLSPASALVLYAGLEVGVGVAALGVDPLLVRARPVLAAAWQDGQGGPLFAGLRLLICLLVVTIPATLMGASFPAAVRWLEHRAVNAGRTAGRFYTAHTLGAALGAAITGFVILPSSGLHTSTLIGVWLNIAVGVGALALGVAERFVDTRRSRAVAAAAARDEAAANAAGTTTTSADIAEASRLARQTMARERFAGGFISPQITPQPRPGTVNYGANESSPRAHPGSAAIALAISGFVALVHEVAWTRVIALLIGPTTYAFSAMLAVCILGLAGGSALATQRLSRTRRPVTALALTQIVAAIGAFVAAGLVPQLPSLVASLVRTTHPFGSTFAIESLAIAILLLPMTLALGAAFPFGVATAAPASAEAAGIASRMYSANTLGAIGGALAGGFLFIPHLGLQRTIVFAGLIGVLSGVELIWRTRRRGHARIWIPMLGLGTASLGLALPSWNPAQLASGSYRQANADAPDVRAGLDSGTLLYYDDGAAGTVSVRRVAGTTTLAINGTVDASNAADMLRQTLLAHLPLLLHPSPREVCVIGLGSGVTTGAALAHPVTRVDTIELSREVVRASDFFTTENRAALQDPRGHLVVGDGRTHLRLAHRVYDVIVSEPSSPWIAGAAPLFTREFFIAARDHLRAASGEGTTRVESGLFAQRVHVSALSRADFRSILATFLDVFPHTSLWLIGDADVLLVGGRAPMAPLIEQLPNRWHMPGVVPDLERVHVTGAFGLLSSFVAEDQTIATLASGAPVQTDDRTALEFSAPHGLHERTDHVAWLMEDAVQQARPAFIQQAEQTASAADWRDRARMLLGAGAHGLAYDAATRALSIDPTDTEALGVITATAGRLGRETVALALLDQAAARAPDTLTPLLEVSRMRVVMGDLPGAIATATAATSHFPDAFEAWQALAQLLGQDGARSLPKLAEVVTTLKDRYPDRWETRYFDALLHLVRGEISTSAQLGEQVLKERPSDPRTLALVGTSYARLGIRARARDAFEASIQADPRDPANYVRLARFELDTFNAPRAAALFSEALVLDPRSPDALNGLADALATMGRGERARELRSRAGS